MKVTITHLTFVYPGRSEPSLGPLDLELEPGTITLLTGATGSGKSTLLRTLNGLIPRSSAGSLAGAVLIDDIRIDAQSSAEVCRRVGLVFQSPDDQVFSTRVLDEARFGLENLGLAEALVAQQAAEALARTGLRGLESSATAALSGGQKQRLALASVLAMRPQLIALDEPLSQLDPGGGQHILALLDELAHRNGLAVVLAEHQLEEALRFTDRVVVLERGRILHMGAPESILADTSALRRAGIEVPPLCRLAERLGLAARPLDERSALTLFANLARGEPRRRDARPGALLLAARALEFGYERRGEPVIALEALELRRGEVVALIGKNGSGKSTLIHLLLGLLRPRRGAVEWLDRDGRRRSPRDRRFSLGYVPQNADLVLQAPRVQDELMLGARRATASAAEATARARECAERLHVAAFAGEPVFSLSAGQRQRVAVAAALVTEPELLILDEPTTGQNRGHLDLLMRDLCAAVRARGASLLFATHDLRTALVHADRVIALAQGHIVFDGPSDGVTAAARAADLELPLHLRVAEELRWSLRGGPLDAVLDEVAP